MPDESNEFGQDEIERLLRESQKSSTPSAEESASAEKPKSSGPAAADQAAAKGEVAADKPVSQSDIDQLLNKAEQALASIDEGPSSEQELPPGMRNFEFERFTHAAANQEIATLELMRDVELDMTIELGRTHMHLEDVLQLKKGAVVPLDKLAGDPADILVNGRLVARGEVLVLNDNFCVRVAELIASESSSV